MTDYEKALKEAHKKADAALDSVEGAAKTAKEKLKVWLNTDWRTVTKGEALAALGIIILLLNVG